jgi:hypothetical protein
VEPARKVQAHSIRCNSLRSCWYADRIIHIDVVKLYQHACRVCVCVRVSVWEPFEKFVDWWQCTAVMKRDSVTVVPSCSGGDNVEVAWSSSLCRQSLSYGRLTRTLFRMAEQVDTLSGASALHNWILCSAWKRDSETLQLIHQDYGVWKHKDSPLPKKFRMNPSAGKVTPVPISSRSLRYAVCRTFSKSGWGIVRSASLAKGGTSKKRPSPHLYKVRTRRNKVSPRTFQTALMCVYHIPCRLPQNGTTPSSFVLPNVCTVP